jgi:hypothetical protein
MKTYIIDPTLTRDERHGQLARVQRALKLALSRVDRARRNLPQPGKPQPELKRHESAKHDIPAHAAANTLKSLA